MSEPLAGLLIALGMVAVVLLAIAGSFAIDSWRQRRWTEARRFRHACARSRFPPLQREIELLRKSDEELNDYFAHQRKEPIC